MGSFVEIVASPEDEKQLVREVAAALAPSEAAIARRWARMSTAARSAEALEDTVRLFLTSLADGDFQAFFVRIDERGTELARTREQYEELVLAFHVFEEAILPELRRCYGERLIEVLGALDHVFHNVLAILARAYFRELEREREKYLSLLAHDLKTPLASILLSADAIAADLRRGEAPRPGSLAATERIQRNTQHLSCQIDNLLTFGKLKSGKVQLELSRVDLVSAVAEAARLVLPVLSHRGMTLTVNGLSHDETAALEPVLVEAGQDLILRSIGNYLSNAARHARKRVTVSVEDRGASAVIAVKDDGPGIDAEELDRIFDDYYTLPGGNPGTGLGLPSVRMIAALHHGQAWAESELGKGSTFYLQLPKKQ